MDRGRSSNDRLSAPTVIIVEHAPERAGRVLNAESACHICQGPAVDARFERVQVWEDRWWRLITKLNGPVPGYSFLVPKRHIPYVTDLDGEEAATFGAVLARVTKALRDEMSADLIYVHVFGGGVAHLHIHLAPHRSGDALNDQVIRGAVTYERLPSGGARLISHDFPMLPESDHRAAAAGLRERLVGG